MIRHRADFGVYHPDDSGFPTEAQLNLCPGPLRRIQHYPIFFEHYESRAGESQSMLNKEEPRFGVILPFRQQISGTPFIYSDDAARRKVWKGMHISFANSAIKKSSLV
jgi:hypothetical protein